MRGLEARGLFFDGCERKGKDFRARKESSDLR